MNQKRVRDMTKEQVTDESCERIYGCIGSVTLSVIALFGLMFVVATFYLSYVFMNIPITRNINSNQEALTVEDVWTVDGQFSLWIDDVSEISGDLVKKAYREVWETEGKRYFDVSFSFQNIGFPGLQVGDQWESDYLSVEASARTIAKSDETHGTRLQTFGQEAYHTAVQDGVEVPVTIGITASDNHMIVAVDETERAFYMNFCVDAEASSMKGIWQYAQNFLVNVSENARIEDGTIHNIATAATGDSRESGEGAFHEKRTTSIIWSETVSENGINGITTALTPIWNFNQTAKVTFIITNSGNTPVLFSVIDGTFGSAIGYIIVPVSGTRSLTVNGSDIPKTIRQGVYYANITVRAVNANYEPDTIDFHVTGNLITN